MLKREVYWPHWISPVCSDRTTEVLFEGSERNVFERPGDAAAHVAEGESGAVESIRMAGLNLWLYI